LLTFFPLSLYFVFFLPPFLAIFLSLLLNVSLSVPFLLFLFLFLSTFLYIPFSIYVSLSRFPPLLPDIWCYVSAKKEPGCNREVKVSA
jgi:hypothetical protein